MYTAVPFELAVKLLWEHLCGDVTSVAFGVHEEFEEQIRHQGEVVELGRAGIEGVLFVHDLLDGWDTVSVVATNAIHGPFNMEKTELGSC